jgi:hypothetical protein
VTVSLEPEVQREIPPAGATDHEVAEGIRDGKFASPQVYGDFWLFDVRVTGTGMAWRESLGEWAHRDPELWTSPEFVQRCNGLAVIWLHPPTPGLNTEEFRQRSIGSIVLPYVKGDEVWGIAKIFDEDAALAMQYTHKSTSPGVTPPKGAQAVTLESGDKVLDEGLPLILDHLAICEAGVWDKDGPPEGIRLDSLIGKGEVVTEEEKAKLEKERDDAKTRADAAESELKSERDDRAKKDAADAARADKAKKDAEETEKAEKEKADAKRDSRKDRHARHDAKDDIMDCSRCDSEEKEEIKEKERDDKKRKDAAAAEVVVEAGRGTEEIKDSKKKLAEMEAHIAELQRAAKPLSFEDRDAISKSYHRYDSLYASLMDVAPDALNGESPIAYRKRCANGLRRYTTSFKNYVFHDSQQDTDFALVERAIFDEAVAYAKNPPAETISGIVREVHKINPITRKHETHFIGDAKAVWAPFGPPEPRYLKGFKNPSRIAAR